MKDAEMANRGKLDKTLTKTNDILSYVDYSVEALAAIAGTKVFAEYLSSMTMTTLADTKASLSLLTPAYNATGSALMWSQVGTSVYQGANNINRGNYLGASKNGLDIGMGFWGLTGSVATSTAGVLYFGVGAFYPGGWNGAMQMNGSLIQQNQQIVPDFNLYGDYP